MEALLGMILGSNLAIVIAGLIVAKLFLYIVYLISNRGKKTAIAQTVDGQTVEIQEDPPIVFGAGEEIKFGNDIICKYKGFAFPAQIIISDFLYEFHSTVDIGNDDFIDMKVVKKHLDSINDSELFYFLKPGGIYKLVGEAVPM